MFPDMQTKNAALIFAAVLVIGCDRTTVQTVQTVATSNSSDRLIRRDWITESFRNPDRISHDSHSLVWQREQDGAWRDHVTITQDDFQRGSPHRRWVSDIHSFDPETAIAIVKIAEGNAPEGSPVVSYVYSWREWDVKNNREVKTIRQCMEPFEKYSEMPSTSERP